MYLDRLKLLNYFLLIVKVYFLSLLCRLSTQRLVAFLR